MKRWMAVLVCMVLLGTTSFASAKDVYATKNGKKYHTADCRWVKNRDVVKMTEEEAVKKGLAPCGACMKEDDAAAQDGSSKKAAEAKDVKAKK